MKRRKQEEDFADLLIQALKESMESPDFMDKMEAAGKNRDILFKGQRPNDSDYGYSASNPIMTSTIASNEEYLKKLRTTDGRPFTWNRAGSITMREIHGVPGVIVDEYKLFLDGKEYKTVYICPYGHNTSYVPLGMKLDGQSAGTNKSAQSFPMLKESLDAVKKPVNGKQGTPLPEKFCRACGASLVPEFGYCPKCGKQVLSRKAADVSMGMKQSQNALLCPGCGKKVFPGQKYCNQCGVSLIPTDKPNKVERPTAKRAEEQHESGGDSTILSLSGLSPLLRRAFIFIEDEEWDRADEYLERVLDKEPENAYAYLGKAMVAVKVGTPTEPTLEEIKNLLVRKEYSRAKRYADTELAQVFKGWEKRSEVE